ncbi:MAG: AI-2E family transporter [Paludibacteraceae bacterium]|nr:AI-2E family transporter [Paludibacteraceae bacterium]
MKDKEVILPFYAKASIFIVGLIGSFAILYITQWILIPLVFAVIIAMVLHPVVFFLVRRKMNRIVAIIAILVLSFLLLAAFGLLLYTQASQFSQSWPTLVDKFTNLLNLSITNAASYFDINPQLIHDGLTKIRIELINGSSTLIGQTLISVGSGVAMLFLIPVYVFILLFYQPLLMEFIHLLFIKNNQSQVKEIITQTKTLIQHYLIGLFIEFILVATLYSITLFLLGINYAILLGIIGALLNVIPYIGGIVGTALPMMVAFVTKDSGWYPIYVLVIYYVIQLIDNHYIVPWIVASKVKINALFSILAVFVGNALWGVAGMFLAIPMLAIIKLIFDHIEPLKSWGFLLGNTTTSRVKKEN